MKQGDITTEELARTEVKKICCILCQEFLNITMERNKKPK